MDIHVPKAAYKRIVIIGAGFAGLKLAQKLADTPYQIVLIDKNNYHQFQPLFYQVATAGLEPSAISFPLRKIFQGKKNVHIRMAEVYKINPDSNTLDTNLGTISYDYAVLAMGCTTNYFGMENIKKHAFPMKSVTEAMALRNKLLQNFEDALLCETDAQREAYMNVVVVGGGATGVEICGTLAEMKSMILPKDYPELDFSQMNIYLIEGSPRTLNAMADVSAKKSREYLEKLGVIVFTQSQVKDYDGEHVHLGNQAPLRTRTLIWAAGVTAHTIEGLPPQVYVRGNRLKVNRFNQIEGFHSIFALGDVAFMVEDQYPHGHPQVAQPAIQQAENLAKNFLRMHKNKPLQPFTYKNLGSMATVGRNLAVVEFPFIKFQGFFAWLVWMFVHLMSIVGVKNRLLIFINWCWNYITYDQSLRLILKSESIKKSNA